MPTCKITISLNSKQQQEIDERSKNDREKEYETTHISIDIYKKNTITIIIMLQNKQRCVIF